MRQATEGTAGVPTYVADVLRAPDIPTSPRPGLLPVAELRHNSYITDGCRLFRCILSERGPMLMLEDCRTLDLVLCSFAELAETEMRIVKAQA